MANSQKSVLIVSYTFPPSGGVGGRRWAKFAKYLMKSGIGVTVLTSRPEKNAQSSWTDDTKGIPIIHLPARYPGILNRTPKNIFEKISYRAWIFLLRILVKGSVYDRAVFWENQFVNKCVELIREKNIRNLIITGAPFRLCYYSTQIKTLIPEINLIVDLRDPWTWGGSHGYKQLSKENFEYEKKMESEVMSKADAVCSPSPEILEHLKKEYPLHKNKLQLLPHGFDTDDFGDYLSNKKDKNAPVKITYGGTYYEGLMTVTDQIAEVVRKNIIENFEITFYCNKSVHTLSLCADDLKTRITFTPLLSAKEYFTQISKADYYLVMYPDKFKDQIGTKFIELVKLRLPIIYIGNPGAVGDFVSKNKLGKHILPENIRTELPLFLKNKNLPDYNSDFNIEEFGYTNLTRIVIDKLLK